MSFIIWLIIGGLAGFVAGNVMKAKRPYGALGDIVLGIVGGMVGGFLLTLVGLGANGLVGSFVTAFIGAVVLIWAARKIS